VAFSTVEEAHTGLIERLAGSKPRRILYIADAQDIEERAEHLQPILGAMLDYVGAIVTDTDHIAPGIDRPEIPPGLDLRCGRRCCRLNHQRSGRPRGAEGW
jgi:hypothetical protein